LVVAEIEGRLSDVLVLVDLEVNVAELDRNALRFVPRSPRAVEVTDAPENLALAFERACDAHQMTLMDEDLQGLVDHLPMTLATVPAIDLHRVAKEREAAGDVVARVGRPLDEKLEQFRRLLVPSPSLLGRRLHH